MSAEPALPTTLTFTGSLSFGRRFTLLSLTAIVNGFLHMNRKG